MNITSPYLSTPRGNKYLITFTDYFTEYADVKPIPHQTAKTFARIYETKVLTLHGIGSRLITDQGQVFMSPFFRETCKILRTRTTRPRRNHPLSNGTIERWHRSLRAGLSRYENAVHTNCDVLVPFYLMAYRQ